jgi:hypothetical protein
MNITDIHAVDAGGSTTWPPQVLYEDNPFNVLDIVVSSAVTPPVVTGASVSVTSGMLGDTTRFDLSGTDDQGVNEIFLFWTKPDGSTFRMACGGGSDTTASCHTTARFGYSDFSQAGTYTYKGMNITDIHAVDAGGSTTWPPQVLYEDNPFNVLDIVVQGN